MAYFSQGNTSSNMQEQNNPSFLESFNFIDVMMESSDGDFHEPPLPFPHHHLNDLHTSFNHNNKFQNGPPFYHPSVYGPNNTSKAESCLLNPSFPVSGIGLLGDHNSDHTNHSHGGKKRKRNSEREVEKTGEVVHVRAKRGQATDRHSLAERLRREKINEKLRSLQDLVPGCYKAMGMAVMLDVIVDYVRSLQNQIEFLSMKLSAASLFYDFNSSETEAMETMQGTNGYEAQLVMERMAGGAYGGGSAFPHFQSSWPI